MKLMQSTCSMLKQSNREMVESSAKARQEDRKRRKELKLEIKKSKEHVQSLRTIASVYEERYTAELKQLRQSYEVTAQQACHSE